MKSFKLKNLLATALLATLFAACTKDKITVEPPSDTDGPGLFIINQGNFGANNSTLTYYNLATKKLFPDFYNTVNTDKKIGDTGNDVGIYGSKMYIIVNNSSNIEVVNAKTGMLIKEIALNQCRNVVFYKSNAFVTSYDGKVAVIDTTSLTITKNITVGRNPEQMVISNNKLYVANSGGLSLGNPDKTVSVVDLTALAETKKIDVIENPVSMTADNFGNVYVLSLGNYSNIAAGLTIIDNQTDAVKSKPVVSLGYSIPIVALGDFVYYPTADNKIAVYNAKTQAPEKDNFITDGTTITSVFALTANQVTGEIFVADAKDFNSNGTLTAFDKNGKKEYSITTGISPGRVILVNN
jgi:YVTN family beta-propeller protein